MKKLFGIALLTLGLSTPAHALSVFFDNFNSNVPDQLNATPTGWTTANGTADIIGSGGAYDFYPGNGSYVDLDGSKGATGQNTTLVSNASFNLNGNYKFSFDFGLNHNDLSDTDKIEVGFFDGSNFIAVLTADAGVLGTLGSVFSTASATANIVGNNLKFYIRGLSSGRSDQSGGLIDNFSVSTIPLPASAILFFSGLVGLGALRRMRRRAQ